MPEMWRGGMVVFASDVGALMGHKGGFGVSWLEAFARFARRNVPQWTPAMDVRRQRAESRAMEHVRRTVTQDLEPPPHDNEALSQMKRRRLEQLEEAPPPQDPEVASAARDLVVSELNTQFGTEQEGGAIHAFERRSGAAVTHRNERTMYGPWVDLGARGREGRWRVAGRVDGVCEGHVLEIKQRAARLFGHLPSYEFVQVQAYMQILGHQAADERLLGASGRAKVVQQLLPGSSEAAEGVQGECWVERDDGYWSGVAAPCLHWLAGCVLVMRHEECVRAAWARSTDQQREHMLLRLIPRAFELRHGRALPVPDVAAQQLVPRIAFANGLTLSCPSAASNAGVGTAQREGAPSLPGPAPADPAAPDEGVEA